MSNLILDFGLNDSDKEIIMSDIKCPICNILMDYTLQCNNISHKDILYRAFTITGVEWFYFNDFAIRTDKSSTEIYINGEISMKLNYKINYRKIDSLEKVKKIIMLC